MKYLVKKTIKATDDNENFAGEVKTYYLGKGGRCFDEVSPFELESWGYKRKSDAEKCLESDEQSDRERTYKYYWETTSREVVAFD